MGIGKVLYIYSGKEKYKAYVIGRGYYYNSRMVNLSFLSSTPRALVTPHI